MTTNSLKTEDDFLSVNRSPFLPVSYISDITGVDEDCLTDVTWKLEESPNSYYGVSNDNCTIVQCNNEKSRLTG